jgi:hypothetical protein
MSTCAARVGRRAPGGEASRSPTHAADLEAVDALDTASWMRDGHVYALELFSTSICLL